MENYKHFTGVVFVVELSSAAGAKNADLIATAYAYETGRKALGARPLVSASVSCRQQGYSLLESAVLKAMYDLDVKLYADDYISKVQ
jgi:hypothetical protein